MIPDAELEQWLKDEAGRDGVLQERLRRAVAEIRRLRPFEPQLLSSNSNTSGHEIRVAAAKGLMGELVKDFDALNGNANYTETDFITAGPPIRSYRVTVHGSGKPTPHQLRKAAEEERDNLREEVARLNAGIDYIARFVKLSPEVDGPAWNTPERITQAIFCNVVDPQAVRSGGTGNA